MRKCSIPLLADEIADSDWNQETCGDSEFFISESLGIRGANRDGGKDQRDNRIAELEAANAAREAREERAQERRNTAIQKRAENTLADREKILAQAPDDAKGLVSEILDRVLVGAPTYVLGVNRERIAASYIGAAPGVVQTSHVGSDFHKNPEYLGKNTRPYDTDEVEQNKVRQIAAPGALDEDSIVTDIKSAADGPSQVVIAIDNDKTGSPKAVLQTAGGNGREMGVNLSPLEDQDRLSDKWYAEKGRYQLDNLYEGWRGYRFLGIYDLRDETQRLAYQQLVDKLNPAPGVVQDISSRADIDAALNIPVERLVGIPLTLSPTQAVEVMIGFVRDSEKLGLDRNVVSGLVKSPVQSQHYIQRLLIAAAFRSKALGEFFAATNYTSGHATIAGLIKSSTGLALQLRHKGYGGIADALGRTMERIIHSFGQGRKLNLAISEVAEQQDFGENGEIINAIAKAIASKVEFHPPNKRGIKSIDSEETQLGFDALMADLGAGVSRFTGEADLYGNPMTIPEIILASLDVHARKSSHPTGKVIMSRGTQIPRRIRDLQRKSQLEGLTRWESEELAKLEKASGQDFFEFLDAVRKENFALETETQRRDIQPAPVAADQTPMLFSRKPGTQGGLPVDAVKRAVQAAARKYGLTNMLPNVEVVDSIEDRPEGSRASRAASEAARYFRNTAGQIEGYYNPRTGQIVLNASAIPTTARAVEVFLHEAVGHAGMGAALKWINPKGYENLLKLLQSYKLENGASLWASVQSDYKGAPDAVIFDEALARLSENPTRSQREEVLWNRIVSAIKLWLAKIGFKDWTDADVKSLIARSAEGLRTGKQFPGSKAETRNSRIGQTLRDADATMVEDKPETELLNTNMRVVEDNGLRQTAPEATPPDSTVSGPRQGESQDGNTSETSLGQPISEEDLQFSRRAADPSQMGFGFEINTDDKNQPGFDFQGDPAPADSPAQQMDLGTEPTPQVSQPKSRKEDAFDKWERDRKAKAEMTPEQWDEAASKDVDFPLYSLTDIEQAAAAKMVKRDFPGITASTPEGILGAAQEKASRYEGGMSAWSESIRKAVQPLIRENVAMLEADRAKRDAAQQEPAPGTITDFGEKIGGARKDTAKKTGPTGKKPTDERPAWARRYQIQQTIKSTDESEEGRWFITDLKNTNWRGEPRQATQETFATKEEAQAALPLIAVARNHYVRMEEVESATPATPAPEVDVSKNLADIAAKIDAIKNGPDGALLFGLRNSDQYTRDHESGMISPEIFANLKAKGSVFTPEMRAKAVAIQEEIDKILGTSLVPDTPTVPKKYQYTIWRNVDDHKRIQVVDQKFDSREDAMRYMAANAVAIIETKTAWREELFATPEKPVRTGKARRTGPATAEMFQDTFGFRGVEFGNWMRQQGDGIERQEVLNNAYDGLLDLADVLGVPAKAISLNGELALAFGARGQGLQGAKAHYERNFAVINLTKMSGAGSLAHEWFHALDHYLARLDGKAAQQMVANSEGNMIFPAKSREGDYASHGFGYKSQARQALRDAYTRVIDTIFRKAVQFVEDSQKAEKFVARTRTELEEKLGSIRKELAEQKDPRYQKRNNKPATPEQLAEFDRLANGLIEGKGLEIEYRINNPDSKALSRGSMSGRWTNDTLEAMSGIYKAVRGRSGFNSEGNGVFNQLGGYLQRYAARIAMLESAAKSEQKTKTVPTSFYMEAKRIDQGSATDYWTTPHEMAARAFSAYVEDKIADQGGAVSDYLSYGSDNSLSKYRIFNLRPFPEGAERVAINEAFDNLFATIEAVPTEKGFRLQEDAEFSVVDPLAQTYRNLDGILDANPTPIIQEDHEYQAAFNFDSPKPKDGQETTGLVVNGVDGNNIPARAKIHRRDRTILGNAVQRVRVAPTGSLLGSRVESASDVAEISEIYRNPRFETLRVYYVNTSGTIIHESAVSSRMTGYVGQAAGASWNTDTDALFDEIRATISKTGAAGFYMVHNHPSGEPVASGITSGAGDIQVTRAVAEEFGKQFKGAAIINHKKYSTFRAVDGHYEGVKTITGSESADPLLTPSVPHMALGSILDSVDAVAALAKGIEVSKNSIVFIGADSRGKTRIIASLDERLLARPKKLAGVINHYARQSGSRLTFIGGISDAMMEFHGDMLSDAITGGFLVDVVSKTGKSLTEKRRIPPNLWKQQELGRSYPSAKTKPFYENPAYYQPELDFDAAQADSTQTAAERFKAEMPKAMIIAASFNTLPNVELSDLQQTARIALAKAARNFDPTRGVPFASLASLYVRNALLTYIRGESRQLSQFPQSLDEKQPGDFQDSRIDHTPDPRAILSPDAAALDESREFIEEAIGKLPARMQTIVRGYYAGREQVEIAAELGVSKQAVQQLQKVAFERMRRSMAEKGVTSITQIFSRPASDGGNFEDEIESLLAELEEAGRFDAEAMGQRQEQAQAEDAPGIQKKIGRPDLAYGAQNADVRGADQDYTDRFVPQTQAQWDRDAELMLAADFEGTKNEITRAGLAGETISPAQTRAAAIIAGQLRENGVRLTFVTFDKSSNF